MDKLEAMEQMSKRIDSKCKEHNSCYNCILHEYKLDDDDIWCRNYSCIEDYKNLVLKCKLLNIDISDLLVEESLTICKTDTKFTVNDIKSGFLLQVIDTIADEEIICIGIQNEDNIFFYKMDTNYSFEKLFCINDIASDFNIKNNYYSVTKIYGHINKPDSCNMFTTRNRPLLWSRSDKTYWIQNGGEQIIYIAPNEKEYRDGNVYIEDKTDENAYISISPANLSDLISILQEIYKKNYKE